MKDTTKNKWKKFGWFCYSFAPTAAYFLLSILVGAAGSILVMVFGIVSGASDIYQFTMGKLLWINILCQVIGLIGISLWYYFGCGRPSPKWPQQFKKVKYFSALILAGIGLQLAISMILTVIEIIFPHSMDAYEELMQMAGLTETSAALLVSVVLLAPLMEELIFRGLTLAIAKKFTHRFWIANTIQALAFGIMHMNLVQSSYAFVMGLLLGYVYQRFHSLYASILLHLVINAAGTLLMPLVTAVMPDSWVSILVVLLLGVLLLGLGMRMLVDKNQNDI